MHLLAATSRSTWASLLCNASVRKESATNGSGRCCWDAVALLWLYMQQLVQGQSCREERNFVLNTLSVAEEICYSYLCKA